MFNKKTFLQVAIGAVLASTAMSSYATTDPSRPNILAIWGDDIGMDNLSAYTKEIGRASCRERVCLYV